MGSQSPSWIIFLWLPLVSAAPSFTISNSDFKCSGGSGSLGASPYIGSGPFQFAPISWCNEQCGSALENGLGATCSGFVYADASYQGSGYSQCWLKTSVNATCSTVATTGLTYCGTNVPNPPCRWAGGAGVDWATSTGAALIETVVGNPPAVLTMPLPGVSSTPSASPLPPADETWCQDQCRSTPGCVGYSYAAADCSLTGDGSTLCWLLSSLPPGGGTANPCRCSGLVSSPTPSVAASKSRSGTRAASVSRSGSLSLSRSGTQSATRRPSISVSGSLTKSVSITPSLAPSPSSSPSLSPSVLRSPSVSASSSVAATISKSGTGTPTVTGTTGASVTASASKKATVSLSASFTRIASATRSGTLSPSISKSPSRSLSVSLSISASISASPTASATSSPSMTSSSSVSSTRGASTSLSASTTTSPTLTTSLSGSGSWTVTLAPSPSLTASVAASSSGTRTLQSSPDVSPSNGASGSTTASLTATLSMSRTTSATLTLSASSSLTASVSPSVTQSRSKSISGTLTGSKTQSKTRSSSQSSSVSLHPTESRSPTLSPSPTRSQTQTASESASETPSISLTRSTTPSSSRSKSSSPSISPSKSETQSESLSASQARSPSTSKSVDASISGTSSVSSSYSASSSASRSGTPSASASLTASATRSVSATSSRGTSASMLATGSTSKTASASPAISLPPSTSPAPGSITGAINVSWPVWYNWQSPPNQAIPPIYSRRRVLTSGGSGSDAASADAATISISSNPLIWLLADDILPPANFTVFVSSHGASALHGSPQGVLCSAHTRMSADANSPSAVFVSPSELTPLTLSPGGTVYTASFSISTLQMYYPAGVSSSAGDAGIINCVVYASPSPQDAAQTPVATSAIISAPYVVAGRLISNIADIVVETQGLHLRSSWGPFLSLEGPLWNRSGTEAMALLRSVATCPSLPSLNLFAPLPGAANITLVADCCTTFSSTNGSSSSSSNNYLNIPTPVMGSASLPISSCSSLFSATTIVRANGLLCPISWLSSDRRFLRVQTPPLEAICSTTANGRVVCPPIILQVERATPTSVWQQLETISARPPPGSAFDYELSSSLATAAAIQASVSCPPFCGSLPAFQLTYLAGEGDEIQVGPAIPPIGGLVGGLQYVSSCSDLSSSFTDPLLGQCSNWSSPLKKSCGYGAGQDCAPCSSMTQTGICPGGYIVNSGVGEWISFPGADSVVQCSPPASERCPGWSYVLNAAACGVGYQQGSIACRKCAEGYYPVGTDARCTPCAVSDKINVVFLSLGIFLASACLMSLFIFTSVFAVSKVYGGTVRGGTRRIIDFLQSTWLVLQIISQVGQNVSPGLPPSLSSMYEIFSVVQFHAVTISPRCFSSSLLFQQVLVFTISFSLLGAAALLHWGDSPRVALPPGIELASKALVSASSSKSMRVSAFAVRVARRVVFLAISIIFSITCNEIFASITCQDVALPVSSYLQLAQDGTTLKNLHLPIIAESQQLHCLTFPLASGCTTILGLLQTGIPVRILSSDSYIVCGEAGHDGVELYAYLTLGFFCFLYPLIVTFFMLRRIKTVLKWTGTEGIYEAFEKKDKETIQAYINNGQPSASLRFLRRMTVLIFSWVPTAFDLSKRGSIQSRSPDAGPAASKSSAVVVSSLSQSASAKSAQAAASLAGINATQMFESPMLAAKGDPQQKKRAVVLTASKAPPTASASTTTPSLQTAAAPIAGNATAEDPGSRLAAAPPAQNPGGPVSAATAMDGAGGAAPPSPRLRSRRLSTLAPELIRMKIPLRVRTAQQFIDFLPAIQADGSLAYFVSGDFRASRFFFRLLDLYIYLGIAYANTLSSLPCFALTCFLLLIGGALLVIQRPVVKELRWLLIIRIYVFLLSAFCAMLNYISALDYSAHSPTSSRVTTLSYIAFVACVLLIVTLFVAFFASLLSGARNEAVEGGDVAKQERDLKLTKSIGSRSRRMSGAVIAAGHGAPSPRRHSVVPKKWTDVSEAPVSIASPLYSPTIAASPAHKRALSPRIMLNPTEVGSDGANSHATARAQLAGKRASVVQKSAFLATNVRAGNSLLAIQNNADQEQQ